MWCWRPPVHAQHVEERAEAQRRRNSLGKMDSWDDAGEKKLEKSKANCRQEKSKANCRQEKSKANCRQEKSIANSRQRHM